MNLERLNNSDRSFEANWMKHHKDNWQTRPCTNFVIILSNSTLPKLFVDVESCEIYAISTMQRSLSCDSEKIKILKLCHRCSGTICRLWVKLIIPNQSLIYYSVVPNSMSCFVIKVEFVDIVMFGDPLAVHLIHTMADVVKVVTIDISRPSKSRSDVKVTAQLLIELWIYNTCLLLWEEAEDLKTTQVTHKIYASLSKHCLISDKIKSVKSK